MIWNIQIQVKNKTRGKKKNLLKALCSVSSQTNWCCESHHWGLFLPKLSNIGLDNTWQTFAEILIHVTHNKRWDLFSYFVKKLKKQYNETSQQPRKNGKQESGVTFCDKRLILEVSKSVLTCGTLVGWLQLFLMPNRNKSEPKHYKIQNSPSARSWVSLFFVLFFCDS